MKEASTQHYSEQAVTTLIYTEMRLGSSRIAGCMRNSSARPVTIPARTVTGSVSTTNIIPPILATKIKSIEENQKDRTDVNKEKINKKLEKLFFKLTLSGLDNWDQDLQRPET